MDLLQQTLYQSMEMGEEEGGGRDALKIWPSAFRRLCRLLSTLIHSLVSLYRMLMTHACISHAYASHCGVPMSYLLYLVRYRHEI